MKNILKRLCFNKEIFHLLFGTLILPLHSISQSENIQSFQSLPHVSIRALEVINDSTVWFAANHGVWGFTDDNGKKWKIDSIKADSVYPEFRSIASLNDSTILLLSIGSPAYLFKTTKKGETWRIVYTNKHKDIFFDSMKFKNANEGIAIGDPINGCFEIIKTKDGGETWSQIDSAFIPAAFEGEACFAASNTCIDIFKNNLWFATGGNNARVFYSTDFGEHFTAISTPIQQGETMTGIYSVDFIDEKFGVIVGGKYEKTDSSITTIATTNDGGKTWTSIKTQTPFFGSCGQIAGLKNKKQKIIVTGHDGTFLMNPDGTQSREITGISGEKLKFNTLRLSKQNNNVVWLAGSGGRIARLQIQY